MIDSTEFELWLSSQSITRACYRVQQHHTWKPRYGDFNGSNHFELQKSMKNYHINNNGWSNIGQHFSIFPDGTILTGRPLNTSPACILNANSGAICIENVGNFDLEGDQMQDSQSDSIFLCTASILKKIGISTPTKNNVVYHHWYDGNGSLVYHNSGQKSCPGTAFFGGNKLSDFEENFLPKLKAEMGHGGHPPIGLLSWAAVTTDTLNIRSGPASSAALVENQGPLNYGAVIRIYEVSNNGWFRISENKQLWVYGRYTKTVRRAIVNTNDANGRSGPGQQFDIIKVFQKGDILFVHDVEDNWCFTDQYIWIHESLLSE